MANLQSLSNAKQILEDLKRKYRYKKANDALKQESEVQYQLGVCRGKLELSMDELDDAIRTQSANIRAGQQTQASAVYDTGANELDTIQQQMLWDAAIAYMLTKDALVAIKTIGSRDSIASAYEMLDAAVSQMTGKKQHKFLKLPQVRAALGRSSYSYITSEQALAEKEEQLDQIFETLVQTGDIEACLVQAEHPGAVQAKRGVMAQSGRTPRSGGAGESYKERLSHVSDTYDDDVYEITEDMKDVHAPSVQKTSPAVQEAAPEVQAAPAPAAEEHPTETAVEEETNAACEVKGN